MASVIFISGCSRIDHPYQPLWHCMASRVLQSFRPVFAEEGSYNVLAIDLIGHGRSSIYVHPMRYELPLLVEDLAHL